MQRKIAGRCGNRLPECRMAMSIIVAHGVAGDEIINEATESLLDLRVSRVSCARARCGGAMDGFLMISRELLTR